MLKREAQVRTGVAIAAGAPLSGVVDVREMAGGFLKNDGTNWTAADIVFDVCEKVDGTFTTLKDEFGNAVRVSGLATNAAEARKLPDELFACHYFKLHSVAVGLLTNVNQVAAQSFNVILKG